VDRHTPNRTIRAALTHFIGGAEKVSSCRFFISKSGSTYLAITVEDEDRMLEALGKDPFEYQGTHSHDFNFVFAAAYVAEEVSYTLGSLDVREVDAAVAPGAGATLSLPDMAGLTIDDVLMGYNKAAYRIVQKIKGPTVVAGDGRGSSAGAGGVLNPNPTALSDLDEEKDGADPEELKQLLFERGLAANLDQIMEDNETEDTAGDRRTSNNRPITGSPEKPSKKQKKAGNEDQHDTSTTDRAALSTSSSSSQGSGWSAPAHSTRSSSIASLPPLPADSLLTSLNNYNALSNTDANDPEPTEAEMLLRDQEAELADLQAQRVVREAALRLVEEAELKRAAKKASGKPLSTGAKVFTPSTRADASPLSSPPASPVKGRDRSRSPSPNGSASEEERTSTHASPAKRPPDKSTPEQSTRGLSTPDKTTQPKNTPTQSTPHAPLKGILNLNNGGLRPKSRRIVQLPPPNNLTPNSTPAGATRHQ
jgi:hypothetical protein